MDKEKTKSNSTFLIKKKKSLLWQKNEFNNSIFFLLLDKHQSQSDPSKPCYCQQQLSKCSYAFDNLAYGSYVNIKQ